MKFMYSSFQCRLLSLVSFLTLGRTRKFIPPPWYKGGTASYPDVSLYKNVRAKEGGKETTGARSLHLPFAPFPWSLAVHYQWLAITLRKTKRLRRRLTGGGGGVDGTAPRSFCHVALFRNDFTFSGRPLIFLTRSGIFYGWWRCWWPVTSPTTVAILAAIFDFAKN